MRIIGLTGGIGSGKTTVSHIFESLGVPVFYADDEAKELYNDPEVLQQVKQLLNEGSLLDKEGNLDRKKIASIIFKNEEKRKKLNQLLHPLVKIRFEAWMQKQSGPYCIREAAILIESGSYKDCDKIILVTASAEVRLKRVVARDQTNEDAVWNRIKAQISEEERMKYADFVIENNGTTEELKQKVQQIHNALV